MKKITFTDEELATIKQYGEICTADAEKAMQRSGINFDDIEDINEHYENHRWGSDADRKYRKTAVNKAIRKVAKNPLKYA